MRNARQIARIGIAHAMKGFGLGLTRFGGWMRKLVYTAMAAFVLTVMGQTGSSSFAAGAAPAAAPVLADRLKKACIADPVLGAADPRSATAMCQCTYKKSKMTASQKELEAVAAAYALGSNQSKSAFQHARPDSDLGRGYKKWRGAARYCRNWLNG